MLKRCARGTFRTPRAHRFRRKTRRLQAPGREKAVRKVVATIVLGAVNLGLVAQPARATETTNPSKWTPPQEKRATKYYEFQGRDPVCAIKLAKKAYPKFSDWSNGRGRKFRRITDEVKKKCAAVESTSAPTATPSSSAPSGAWTPELEDWAWDQFASGALGSAIHADRRCVLDVIEAHWPDPAALTNATQSDSEIVGREIAARCGRG
jgi:hypothetical protein